MKKALESVPWAKDCKVDFNQKTATVSVDSSKYKKEDLLKAFENTRFKGSIE